MTRKRSLGIEIYAKLEIIVGVLGTIIFSWSLPYTLRELLFEPGYLREMEVLILYITLFSFPFPFLIVFAIGMLILKPFARIANLWLISTYTSIILLLLIIIYVYGIWMNENMNLSFFFCIAPILGAIIYCNIYFLSHPNVKRQFPIPQFREHST